MIAAVIVRNNPLNRQQVLRQLIGHNTTPPVLDSLAAVLRQDSRGIVSDERARQAYVRAASLLSEAARLLRAELGGVTVAEAIAAVDKEDCS
jgi:hypothetical protein